MHRPAGTAGIGRRFALLAAVALASTAGTLAVPGLASAQLTSPTPTASATATDPAPVDPAGLAGTPTDTAVPVASTPSATNPTSTSTSTPTTTAPPAPSSATTAPAPTSAAPTALAVAPSPLAPSTRLTVMGGGYTSPHGPYGTMTTDSCAVCHRAHTGGSTALLRTSSPQSTLCFTCHDGTGASTNVSADFTTPSTTNVASTRYLSATDPNITTGTISNYYRHDATVATSHTLDLNDEFGGVLNRHTECSDCHDPHQSQGVNATVPPAGAAWPISGRLTGVSGVSVVNGGTASAPTQTYTYIDGVTATVSYEYQLCFKCHSAYTTQKSNTGVSKMAWALDAGLEFNTVNRSFHPVEGQGKNQSQKLVDSLTGSSPYKVTSWVFTDTTTVPATIPGTVRCTQCHSASSDFSTSTTQSSDLNSHVSTNRGLLLQNYRDRVLKSSSENYTSADFALCYLCHTDTPFKSETSTATNFSRHGLHTMNIRGKGSNASTNIDLAGAGMGNALCSECHYRTHSTATGSQYDHLISFSPNVAPIGSNPMWVANGSGGTCYLVCHGQTHNGYSY